MSPPAAYPEVPEFLLAQWQEMMSIVSADCRVPVALIMRLHPSQIEVLVSSGGDSPYHPGERENLCTGLYCEHVIATRDRLLKSEIRTFSINCWNEWTEGSMLEPEARYGYGYLDALKAVFPRT